VSKNPVDYHLSKPVLLLAFNDVKTTGRVLASIREARPLRLYFATDGPRLGRDDDIAKINQVRALESMIDWPCQLFTLHQAVNKGCPEALQLALDWFFANEENGIILEHDMLPDLSFYRFCQLMLDKYQDDEEIMHIAGNSFRDKLIGDGDYYFSRIPIIWGWATWRRAWKKYDKTMSTWPNFSHSQNYQNILPWWWLRQKFTYVLDKVACGRTNSWDYQWTYSLLKNNGLAICPNANLITNIGFGPDALNSTNLNDPLANVKLENISFPLKDPSLKQPDKTADHQFITKIYKFNPLKVILRNLGIDLHKLLL
jgi:hypothetical protein